MPSKEEEKNFLTFSGNVSTDDEARAEGKLACTMPSKEEGKIFLTDERARAVISLLNHCRARRKKGNLTFSVQDRISTAVLFTRPLTLPLQA